MLGLLENLLISLINSTHLSAHNRVYSPNSLITFDILEVVIAVCLPPPQWCSSSTSPVHRWTKAKAILQQRKQQVNLCDIVAVKEVVKSLLWPTREKLKVFSSQAPGLEVISLFCNLFFPSLYVCVPVVKWEVWLVHLLLIGIVCSTAQRQFVPIHMAVCAHICAMFVRTCGTSL